MAGIFQTDLPFFFHHFSAQMMGDDRAPGKKQLPQE